MPESSENTSEAGEIRTTFQVLSAEYSRFWPGEAPLTDEADYFRRVHDHGQAALCLSGGGIRSASFGLGVMQALSRQGVLDQFHYLSSVSGGGYINSWLQRWMYNSRQAQLAEAIAAALANRPPPPYEPPAQIVAAQLRDDNEPFEIKQLRQNSNFITPRIGLASNDTWTTIAMSLRNILTNWLVFGPLLLLVALVPNLFNHSLQSFSMRVQGTPLLFYVPLATATLAAAVAAWNTIRAIPSYGGGPGGPRWRNDNWHAQWIVLPFTIWAVAGCFAVAPDLFGSGKWLGPAGLPDLLPKDWELPPGLLLAAATLAGVVAGFAVAGVTRAKGPRAVLLGDIPVAILACGAMTLMLLLGPWLFGRFGPSQEAGKWQTVALALAGPLWLIASQLVATIAFVALRKSGDGTGARLDDDREWLARLSAIKLKLMLLWAVAAFAALVLNLLLDNFASRYDMSLSTLFAAITGYVALAGGRSSKTQSEAAAADAGAGTGHGLSKLARRLPMEMLVAVGTMLFAVLLLLLLARVEMRASAFLADWIQPYLAIWMDPNVMAHWALFFLLLLFLLAMILRIDINRFSLNGLYRNRLARAFLGAARRDRAPDPFTGFDSADNIRLHKLAEKPDGEPARLYPVINVALNVTATENLAWQERKAEPFIFSPLYSGSILLDRDAGRRHEAREGAFILSAHYGGREADLAVEGTGVSLATAMSISGAAASPNMGYHSSAATAFLMTLFNVRLGAWMRNPAVGEGRKRRIAESKPANGLRAILSELGGSTDDRGHNIYLSDGGHFENLGLYEMVRRGCHYIVVADAGCDPQCSFTDLGNAVRKVKIDLNVDIEFEAMHIRRRLRDGEPLDGCDGQVAFAIGKIKYPRLPGESAGRPRRVGRLIYLKPSYFAEEKLPADVVAYAKLNRAFPHESTADQFFSESQFESYRKLGHCLGLTLGSSAGKFNSLGDFFDAAEAALTTAGRG